MESSCWPAVGLFTRRDSGGDKQGPALWRRPRHLKGRHLKEAEGRLLTVDRGHSSTAHMNGNWDISPQRLLVPACQALGRDLGCSLISETVSGKGKETHKTKYRDWLSSSA